MSSNDTPEPCPWCAHKPGKCFNCTRGWDTYYDEVCASCEGTDVCAPCNGTCVHEPDIAINTTPEGGLVVDMSARVAEALFPQLKTGVAPEDTNG